MLQRSLSLARFPPRITSQTTITPIAILCRMRVAPGFGIAVRRASPGGGARQLDRLVRGWPPSWRAVCGRLPLRIARRQLSAFLREDYPPFDFQPTSTDDGADHGFGHPPRSSCPGGSADQSNPRRPKCRRSCTTRPESALIKDPFPAPFCPVLRVLDQRNSRRPARETPAPARPGSS